MRDRFVVDLLDPVDPFELDDDNIPHLFKHGMAHVSIQVDVDLIYDIYLFDEPWFYEADETGSADWIMRGEALNVILDVPLAPSRSGFANKCRPIGLYTTGHHDKTQYFDDLNRWR